MRKTVMNEISNKQKGNNNTQVGEQTNIENKITLVNNGLSPSEASKLAMDLFYDNFPKLQQIASDTARQRAEEITNQIIENLSNCGVININALANPDVQYVLYEGQKNYARFGEKDKLSLLSDLISKRIEVDNNDNTSLKIAIDKAVSVAGFLSKSQLDYLALLFITTKVKIGTIRTINDLKVFFDYLSTVFSNSEDVNWETLQMLGCLQISLVDICGIIAKTYGFDKNDVKQICPDSISKLSGDYSTSQIGTVIAIIHLHNKTKYRFPFETWIHD